MPDLTKAQIATATQNAREARRTGRPEVAQRIEEAMREGKVLRPGEPTETFAPEKEVSTNVITPKRNSSEARWKDFARATSDIDPSVLKTLSRNDVIKILEGKGIIPRKNRRPKG